MIKHKKPFSSQPDLNLLLKWGAISKIGIQLWNYVLKLIHIESLSFVENLPNKSKTKEIPLKPKNCLKKLC